MRQCFFASLMCLVALGTTARAELITVWTFGPNAANYTLVPQVDATASAVLTAGGGSIDATGGNGVAFTDANGNTYVAGQALHWSDTTKSGGDAYITITVNTTGWQDLDLRWDYKSKYDTSKGKGGPVQWDLDYDIGNGWDSIVNNQQVTCDSNFHSFDIDLSGFTDLNDCGSVQIKLHNPKEGTLKDGDYWEDNIQLTGTPVPEPATLSLLALCAAAMICRGRATKAWVTDSFGRTAKSIHVRASVGAAPPLP